MKINTERVIGLRKANSWSQEELAITAGVNLRTIQRIENGGAASLQSKKALASAFDVEVSELDYHEKPTMNKYEYKVLKFDVKGLFGGKVDLSEIEAQLNRYGADGWELSHVSEIVNSAPMTSMLVAMLQRRLG